MRAVRYERFGAAEDVLQVVNEVPRPVIGPNEILIRVAATSVNPIDCAVRSGYGTAFFTAKGLMRMPLIPGRDIAGTVAAVGSDVRDFKTGDKIFAAATNFATAEFISIPAAWAAPMPRSLGFVEAAALPYVALTAWSALVDAAGISAASAPGLRVVISRGAGGVGSFAIQLMKAWGAFVAATCSASSSDLVRSLGADVAVDYKATALDQALQDYDVALDATFDLEEQLLAALKTHANAAYVSIVTPKIQMVDAFGLEEGLRRGDERLANRKAEQAKLGRRYDWAFMQPNGRALAGIGNLVDAGKIRPVVDSVFPMESIVQAHQRCESKQARGKIVVTITP